jgi:hypothetical protein
MKDTYRNLTSNEIEILKSNGCSCDDWNRVRVKEGFETSKCVNVIFSGEIRLGVFSE